MSIGSSFRFLYFLLFLTSVLLHSCGSSSTGKLIEAQVICVQPIIEKAGNPIPEKLGQLFLPFGGCEKQWFRLSPNFSVLNKSENVYVPELLGRSFAGNMRNKKLIDRMVKRGLKKSQVPEQLAARGFDSTDYSFKLKKDLSNHLEKSYYVFFSTKQSDVEAYEGFKIHYTPDSVLAEINRYYCENPDNILPVKIIVNIPSEQEAVEELSSGPYTTSSQLYGGFQYAVFRIPFFPDLSRRVRLVRNPFPKNVTEFLNYLSRDPNAEKGSSIFKDPSQFFAITGAMFEEKDGMPPGLVIDNGRVVKNINLQSGKGNFYKPGPNGIFYIGKNGVDIVETSFLQNYDGIDFALQSGPLLVINNAVNPKFKPSSNNQFARSAVGIRNSGNRKELIFVTSLEPVSFYDIATFMKYHENCERAIHLESINAFMTYPGFIYPLSNQVIMNLLVIR
jgi:hypothetical protein